MNDVDLRRSIVRIAGHAQNETYLVLEVLQSIEGRVARLFRISPDQSIVEPLTPVDRLTVVAPREENSWISVCRLVLRDISNPWQASPVVAFSCKTDFKPFQFRPLLKYFGEAARRILIADETGLGKTIEAGYIIVEEVMRLGTPRVLVLCPPRLRRKWRTELWCRFGLPFRLVSGNGLRNLLKSPEGMFLRICSMDSAKNLEIEEIVNSQNKRGIDLLVIDEIHRMIGRGGDTLRRKLGLSLSFLSEAIIGISATPVHLELEDLAKVLDIVVPGMFDEASFDLQMGTSSLLNRIRKLLGSGLWDNSLEVSLKAAISALAERIGSLSSEEGQAIDSLVRELGAETHLDSRIVRRFFRERARGITLLSKHVNRTSAAEVGEERRRIVSTERVSLNGEVEKGLQEGVLVSASEASLYEDVDRLLKESFSHVHRLQLSSCLPAMIGLLRMGMRGMRTWIAEEPEEDYAYEETERSFDDSRREVCRNLANLYGLLTHDTKWETLVSVIENLHVTRASRKIIVFTHWIPTYRHLTERARSLRGAVCMYVSPDSTDDELGEVVTKFQHHEGFAVLFATDLLREGLDLFAADCIINYDLPYNPQVIEQRIGRVDRVGQISKDIHVINIVVKKSVDEEIYDRILSRIGVFEKALGDMRPITAEMAETAEKTGFIDEDEPVRIATQLEDRLRLMHHEAFSAVEDVLDDEIKEAHRHNRCGLSELHWMVLEHLFRTVCPGAQTSYDFTGRVFSARGLTAEILHALRIAAGPADREIIDTVFREADSESGELRLSMGDGSSSLPSTHPLFQLAVDIVSKSFGRAGVIHTEPERLAVARDQVSVEEAVDVLFLLEYTYSAAHARWHEWRWFGKTPSGSLLRLEHVESGSLLRKVLDASRMPTVDAKIKGLDEEVVRFSKGDFNQWLNACMNKETAMETATRSMRLMSAQARLRMLRELAKAVGPSSEVTEERIGEVEREIRLLQRESEMPTGETAVAKAIYMAKVNLAATIQVFGEASG